MRIVLITFFHISFECSTLPCTQLCIVFRIFVTVFRKNSYMAVVFILQKYLKCTKLLLGLITVFSRIKILSKLLC